MAIIETKNISYSYTGKITSPVLKNISLKIEAGEIIAIQGPSGSGKSTLLHLLGCLSQCQSGKLYIDGSDVSSLSKEQLAFIRNRKLGFIFQQFHLLPRTNVIDNILLPTLYPYEIASEKDKNKLKAIEYAHKLGLDHRLEHYPNKLSGGEQQRVAVARALIMGAKIILADEPTGNLDSKRARQITEILKNLNREHNLTIILVTHEDDIAKQAHRIVHLHDGEIQSIETNIEASQIETPELEYKEKTKQYQKTISPSIKSTDNTKYAFYGLFKTILKLIPTATKNIFRNKTRSILTMLGVVIGISAILVMVTLGQFTKQKILESYTKLGTNTLTIHGYPNWQLQATDIVPVMFESFNIKTDINSLKRIFPQISMTSPMLFSFGKQVSFAGKSISTGLPIMGVGKDFFRIVEKKILMGKEFNNYNLSHASSVCIIGYGVAERLFTNTNPIGKMMHINEQQRSFSCMVIGVLDKIPSNEAGINDRNLNIFVPHTFLKNITGNLRASKIWRIYIKIRNTEDVVKVGYAIQNYFRLKYANSGIFIADPYALLLAQMKRFLTLFTLMLAAISIVALIVGGIGITNMMLVSISERFQEIGIRKAVGATDFSMRIQLLLESTIICCLAGIIGLIGGFIIYESIIYIASKFVKNLHFEIVISPTAIILATISMLIVGIISGLVPALEAEKLDITTALRRE